MSLTPPPSVQKLQAALHAKAKGSPDYRFHALYDKVYRKDILSFAHECRKSNKGAAGVDNQGFEDIEAYGMERWLGELTQELKNRTYRPAAGAICLSFQQQRAGCRQARPQAADDGAWTDADNGRG